MVLSSARYDSDAPTRICRLVSHESVLFREAVFQADSRFPAIGMLSTGEQSRRPYAADRSAGNIGAICSMTRVQGSQLGQNNPQFPLSAAALLAQFLFRQ